MFNRIAATIMACCLSAIASQPSLAGNAPVDCKERITTMSSQTTGPIAQVALPTSDLDAAKRFYSEVLGLPLLFEASGMAFFNAGNVRLMLGPPETPEHTGSGAVVYFQPDDIRSSAESLAGRGVSFLGEPEVVQRTETGELQLHFFRDPDGNLLALMGEVPHNQD